MSHRAFEVGAHPRTVREHAGEHEQQQHREPRRERERVDITLANLSILKTGKAKAIRFSTLEAICRELDCQPGDLLGFTKD